jgi:protein involved in polysaccharide export with SLBB domain
MTRTGIVAIALLVAVGLLSGCGTTHTFRDFSALPPADPPGQGDYLIRPGDSLDIKFYYHPDHNQDNVLVQPDGKIDLPLIGEVKASERTPGQLSTELVQRYSQNLRAPQIAVRIRTEGTIHQPRIYVGGEVLKPGFLTHRPGMTATQAIIEAGGPKDTAAIDSVVLLRKTGEPNQYTPSKIDLASVVEQGDTTANVTLSPSDMIVVPKSPIAKLNLIVEQYIQRMLPVRLSVPLF